MINKYRMYIIYVIKHLNIFVKDSFKKFVDLKFFNEN